MFRILAGLRRDTGLVRSSLKQAAQNAGELEVQLKEDRQTAWLGKYGYGAMTAAASEGLDYCDVLLITPKYQGNPDHYDQHKTPVCSAWPLDQMLSELKGKARGIVDWAEDEGLTVTIRIDKKFDPMLGRKWIEYWLVVSWPEAKAAEVAA